MKILNDYELSKNIDKYYIYVLVKSLSSDMELGYEIRKYINEICK